MNPLMNPAAVTLLHERLNSLRDELIDLAVDLDRRRRPDASDVAMTIAERLRELCDELSGAPLGSSSD